MQTYLNSLGQVLVAIGCCYIPTQALAGELITSTVHLDMNKKIPFSLSGENSEDVIGGEIRLGDKVFRIDQTSRHGLIGASRLLVSEDDAKFEYVEYITFSSSYSEQTVVGKPWPAAQTYIACEQAYNSFIAVYRLNSEQAAKKLGPVPYPFLSDDVANSDESTVYCFNSQKAVGEISGSTEPHKNQEE